MSTPPLFLLEDAPLPSGRTWDDLRATRCVVRDGHGGIQLATSSRGVRPRSRNPLDDLLSLAGVDKQALPVRVLAFAQRHGPLSFCDYGEPWPCSASLRKGNTHHHAAKWHSAEWYGELARALSALLQIARAAKLGRIPPHSHVTTWLSYVLPAPYSGPNAARAARNMIAPMLNHWLAGAGVGLRLEHRDNGAPILVQNQPTPWSRIVLAIALQVHGAGLPALCANPECNRLVAKRRASRPGENAWCERPQCQRARKRLEQARWRARKTNDPGRRSQPRR